MRAIGLLNNLVNGSFSELYHANSASSGDDTSAYDPLSRITSFSRGTLTASGNNGSTLDTITSANLNSTSGVPNQNSWNLDALGNWSSGNGASNTFNSQNEETSNGSNTLTYDNAGNMTTDELGHAYAYDACGRMTATSSDVFQYDALGRNVAINTGSGFEPVFYDGAGRQIQVYLSFNRGLYTQNVWGLGYVNDLILRDRNADTNNSTGGLGVTGSGLEERVYAQHDSQFSVTSLTDGSGTVVQRFAYDPYGAETVLTAAWAAGNDGYAWTCTFQGMTLVPNGGSRNMLQSQTRLYDVDLGRWTSQDVWYLDGMNLQQMAADNPVRYTDPTGRDWTRVLPGKGGHSVSGPVNTPWARGTVTVNTGTLQIDGNNVSPNWIQLQFQQGAFGTANCHWLQTVTVHFEDSNGNEIPLDCLGNMGTIVDPDGVLRKVGETYIDTNYKHRDSAFYRADGSVDMPGDTSIFDDPHAVRMPGGIYPHFYFDDYLICDHCGTWQATKHVSWEFDGGSGQYSGIGIDDNFNSAFLSTPRLPIGEHDSLLGGTYPITVPNPLFPNP